MKKSRIYLVLAVVCFIMSFLSLVMNWSKEIRATSILSVFAFVSASILSDNPKKNKDYHFDSITNEDLEDK